MAVVRLEALKHLAAAIKEEIPELIDHICLGQADPRKDLEYPSLTLLPIRWRYFPEQALEKDVDTWGPAPDRIVVDVGRHEATVQLRLAAKTSYERSVLEQKIIDLFLSEPLHPGILQTVVVTCEALGNFLAAWEFDEDEWEDAGAFDGHFYSVMAVTGILPALVTRESSHTIEQLQLGLTEDFGTEYGPTTFNTSVDVEVVQVNSDGSMEAV